MSKIRRSKVGSLEGPEHDYDIDHHDMQTKYALQKAFPAKRYNYRTYDD